MIPMWLAAGVAGGCLMAGAIVAAVVMCCFATSGRASECERCEKVLQALKQARIRRVRGKTPHRSGLEDGAGP